MFDAFCCPGIYRKLSNSNKPAQMEVLHKCNELSQLLIERANHVREVYKHPPIIYEPYSLDELNAFKIYIESNNQARTAINMALLHRDHAENFMSDLADMRTKALLDPDPNKMKAYMDTFIKVSDFYMNQNMIYDEQKRKMDVKKYVAMARVSRNLRRKDKDKGMQGKIIEISDKDYERESHGRPYE